LVVQLLGEMAEPKELVAALREENARLKGLQGRPSIKPSGMEKGTEAEPGGRNGKRPRRGKVTPPVAVAAAQQQPRGRAARPQWTQRAWRCLPRQHDTAMQAGPRDHFGEA
jgi:hypothetical protein